MSKAKRKENKVTIFDVARKAGVSYSTVSRVVNNFHYISPETRNRVETAMEELGYVANMKARSLAGGRTQTLGLLLLNFEESYAIEIACGIDKASSDAGYDLTVFTTHHRHNKERNLVTKLTQGLVEGLIIILPKSPESYLADLVAQTFPHVLIDHTTSSPSNTVVATNFKGAFDAVSHLIELGHRRIGCLTGNLEVNSALDRLAGYKAALSHHGLPVDDRLIVKGGFSRSEGYQMGADFLTIANRPTAIFASCDTAAQGVMDRLFESHIRVPQEISIIGFDDIPEAANSRPPLTTISQNLREMGHTATRILINQIENGDETTQKVEVKTELIVRDSTRPMSKPGPE